MQKRLFFKVRFVLFSILALAQSPASFALLPTPDGLFPESTPVSAPNKNFADLFGPSSYQIGSEWGKKALSPEMLRQLPPAFRRAALATAKASSATSFFLGVFENAAVMATNHHVFEQATDCLRKPIYFPLLKITATCTAFLGTWNEIDLSLFVVEFKTAKDRQIAQTYAANFAFHTPIAKGTPLVTVGFGVASNPTQALVGTADSDCRVFSSTGEYHQMRDPDDYNPGPDAVWSFANGCDVSHGDSGSAMVDRNTGQVLGLLWTGRIPKKKEIQDSAYLRKLDAANGAEIWTELTYSVPAPKIRDVLLSSIGSLPPTFKKILDSLLEH